MGRALFPPTICGAVTFRCSAHQSREFLEFLVIQVEDA
jgi:hypothetical protein